MGCYTPELESKNKKIKDFLFQEGDIDTLFPIPLSTAKKHGHNI